MFACEHEGVVPDLITTAKGIAGGLPLAAVTGRADLMDSVHAGGLGGTFGGNPVACAAALGAIDAIERLRLVEPGPAHRRDDAAPVRAIAARHPVVGDVRGRGAMIAVELVIPAASSRTRRRPGHRRRLPSTGPGRAHRRQLRQRAALPPPLVIPDALLDEGLDILAAAFDEATN